MKKLIVTLLLCFVMVEPAPAANAAPPAPILGLVKAAVKKAIKAIDLRIQRLQNKTIWLQNAQKEIENTLSKLKLNEISDWTEKQKELYENYYQELMEVKSIIIYYKRIRDITAKQAGLIEEYQKFWGLFQQDSHFTDDELDYMHKVYTGILGESLANIEQIFLIIESFATQMSDAERLKLINEAADRIDQNYDDLHLFNRQNAILSLQRSKTQMEAVKMKRIYGLY
jgi:hypothetical protein